MSVLPLARSAAAAAEDDEAASRAKPKKAPTAFRTISEVADDLHIPQHVLRFWETKFPQVRPLKRGGGRRYYRPDDISLLRRISHLLYTQGYTIKGVQRLLREGGGRLADDIPPPLQDDQEPDAEHEAEQLLLQERAAQESRADSAAAARLPLRFIPRSAAQPPLPAAPLPAVPQPATSQPTASPPAATAPASAAASSIALGAAPAEQEAARLRRAMAALLVGLEGLRSLIDR